MATLVLLVPGCDSRQSGLQQEELRDEVATFPAPAHLVLVHREESGISSCIGGDCPSAVRYYASERSVEATCRDVRRSVDRWGLAEVEWTIDEGSEWSPCSGGGRSAGQALSVSVFDADHLPTLTLSDIDRSDIRPYRSGVLVSLSVLP
jgi:hypothetical protein